VAVLLDGHFGLYRIAAQEPVEIPSHAALLPIFSSFQGARSARARGGLEPTSNAGKVKKRRNPERERERESEWPGILTGS
jgi:hypothetical protein